MPSASDVRLHVIAARGALPEGTNTVPVDLARFFTLIGRVGHDPGLMLLTLRALRQRRGFLLLPLADLSWVLHATEGRLRGWLARLERERLLVYQPTSDFGRALLDIEIIEGDEVLPVDVDGGERRLQHTLPTHWFVQVLPRVGRRTFVCYLYLLAREQDDTTVVAILDPAHMARTVGLWGRFHVQWHLRKLRRHRLIQRHPARGLAVAEPPPLTKRQHALLRLRELGILPRVVWELAAAIALVALFLSILYRP
jgi:hypothetical protein